MASARDIASDTVRKYGSKTTWKQRIKGGARRTPSEFPKATLRRGIEVELEHTTDPLLAMEIAMDHLDEQLDYYDRLHEVVNAETGRYRITDHGREMRSGKAENPSVRYTMVPVDEDGDGENDVSYVTRGGTRDDAIRAVAQHAPDDALLDLGKTRVYKTKHEALAQAKKAAPRLKELAERLSRGGR